VPMADLRDVLPYFEGNAVTDEEWATRIAARQRGIAGRLIG